MQGTVSERLAIASVLPFIAIWVAPLTFYFGNIEEVKFSLSEVVWQVTGIFVASILVIFLVLTIVSKYPKFYLGLSGLLVGLSTACWVQSQLFVWDLGPLDGRGIDWGQWILHMWGEGLVWAIIALFSVFVFAGRKTRVAHLFLQWIYLVGFISILLGYFAISDQSAEKFPEKEDELKTALDFHPDNNILILLFDTFQSDYFELIKNRYPEEVDFLDGFTFYRNTISHYPTTRASLPSLLTGSLYKNEEEFPAYLETAYSKFNIKDYFKKEGYDSKVIGEVKPYSVTRNDILRHFNVNDFSSWLKYLDFSLFKVSPTVIKPLVYNNGDWFLSFFGRDEYPPGAHGTDIRLLELFEKKANFGSNSGKGVFRFIHFLAPHPPWRIDETLKYNPVKGSEGFLRQARGALKIAERMIEKLKDLNIYNSAEIIILADHGTLSVPPVRRLEIEKDALNLIPQRVHSSSLALLLHKKPFADSGITVNDAPLYLSDLACLLEIENKNLDCSEFQSAIGSFKRERTYLFYNWGYHEWEEEYMPAITQYFVKGHAYDMDSWAWGKYRYEPRNKVSLSQSQGIAPGDPVQFTESGFSRNLALPGWSVQESGHRWSEGSKAVLRFKLEDRPGQDLVLRLRAQAYLAAGKIDHQTIKVLVNGQQTAEWIMRGERWHEAPIPAALIDEDGVINIVFEISNPASPAEFGLSEDSRKLGIAARELVLEKKGSSLARITPGEPFDFSETGSSSQFVLSGWSVQESGHRWSEGPKAVLSFKLKEVSGTDLVLRLRAHAFLAGGKIDHQAIKVLVNSQQTAQWAMRGERWYEAPIPAALIDKDGVINIAFEISNPVSPVELGLSEDSRKLGIAARELVLEAKASSG
ncbi:sulfatase-like hydrolase/transferase [Nitrospina watsonii]|nr:sulfatase-like hydrolase/transferase [Nitrospina watsonii]